MTDCQDETDATPEGSIADLREDLAAVAESFRTEAESNRTDRAAAADPVEPPESPEAQIPADKQKPFNPQPVLLMTHAAGSEQRPLPRRSGATGSLVPPVNSESITVQDDVIQAGGSHAVEVTVRNVGGLAARKVDVELYAEHLRPAAKVDTTAGEIRLARNFYLRGDHPDYRVSGVTTLAPDSKLAAFAHMDDDGGPPYEKVLGYEAQMSVAADRTFEGYVGGKPDEFLDGSSVPASRNEFTVEFYEASHAPPGVIGPRQGSDSFFADPDRYEGIHLASVPGRYVADPSDDPTERVDQYLTSSVEASSIEKVGSQSTSLAGGSTTTLSFTITPSRSDFPLPRGGIEEPTSGDPGIGEDDGPGLGRGVTALYARAYSLATSELPDDWSALDHTTSRFVSRADVPRRI